ncbi:MAG: S-layer homology domain-containing protein, partial [Limnochordales bacterium]
MKLIRKGWLALLLLMFVSGGALAQAPDVPPGHWAYDAVRTLLERGYLDAEADGLFHGDDPVSRYALAGLIARLLEDIEAGRVQIGTAADVEMLRRLEGEFRAELVEWHAARQELEEAHAQTQRQIAVIDEQLNNILFALEAVDAELQAMEAAGAQRDQRLDGHDGELAALRDRFAQVQAQLQAAMDELY